MQFSKKLKQFFIIFLSLISLIAISFSLVGYTTVFQQDVSTEPAEYVEADNDGFDSSSLYTAGNSLYDPEAYINSRYDVVSISVTTVEIPSWSYSSQSSLNNVYNSTYGASINGTCGVVACTSIAYYYSTVKGYSNIPSDKDTIFARYINDYYKITGTEGTSSSSYKKAIPWLFSEYGYSISASRVTALYKYTKLKNHANDGIPSTISTSGTDLYGSHAMVVIGYKTYTITYDENKTTTEIYYMVDEGWGRNKAAYLMEGNMPGSWEITVLD